MTTVANESASRNSSANSTTNALGVGIPASASTRNRAGSAPDPAGVLSTSTPSHSVAFVLRVSVSCRLTVVAASLALAACRQTPIARNGPAQQALVSRTYQRPMRDLRAAILTQYQSRDARRPEMF